MERLLKSSLVHIAFGFLAMGGWALFANRGHGLDGAWLPALVQGTISGALTGVLKKTLETLDGRLKGAPALVVPPAVTAGSILTLLVLVHAAIGTPEVIATIAVPWSVSTLYAIVYNAGLVRARRNAP
jgi:mannose/fructose/N-acetylgalactosamine-specific phosphotransferase system component IIC